MNLVKILQDIPTIETTTVTLRKIKIEDACHLFRYYNNKNVYQYLDWNGPESTEDADRIIRIWNRGFEEGWIIWKLLKHSDLLLEIGNHQMQTA